MPGIIPADEAEASPRYRLEDPFFGAWLRYVQEGPNPTVGSHT